MKRYGWLVFLILEALVIVFALYNALFIPAIEPADPDLGWAWLTNDPEVIEYIKFNFRNQGIWVFGYGLLLMATAAGLRQGQKWAWIGLWSLPLVLVLYMAMAPWTLPMLILPLVAAVVTLLLSRPTWQS